MKSIGGFLLLIGLGSMALNFLGYEFKLLMWIDAWGEQVGWAIRIGLAVVGAGLWMYANNMEGQEPEGGEEAAE